VLPFAAVLPRQMGRLTALFINSKDAATRLSRMYLCGWTLTPFPALTD
jgi:hypothetical protein